MSTTHFDWVAIRTDFERGLSISGLARKYGCSRKAIYKHARAGGWAQDIGRSIRQSAPAKVAGIGSHCDPHQTATAITNEAERVAEVTRRHRAEWEDIRMLHRQAVELSKNGETEFAFKAARFAKTMAECVRITHDGERRAWGIDAATVGSDTPDAELDEVIAREFDAIVEQRLQERLRDGDRQTPDRSCLNAISPVLASRSRVFLGR